MKQPKHLIVGVSLTLFYAVDWASLSYCQFPKDERDALVTEFRSFLENTATVR